MAFKLRSGNGTTFKNMGTSPFKDMKTGKYEHSFESPAKHTDKVTEGSNLDPKHAAAHNKKHTEGGTHGKIGSKDNKWIDSKEEAKITKIMASHRSITGEGADPKNAKDGALYKAMKAGKNFDEKKSPAKQRSTKGGEGKDQNKIFNNKGEHVGNYVNGKKVMLSQEAIEDARGVTTNIKMPKVMKDGPKNKVHGVKNPGNWQPHPDVFKKPAPSKQTRKPADRDNQKRKSIVGEKTSGFGPVAQKNNLTPKQNAVSRAEMKGIDSKSPYWYKIDGKTVSKKQYLNYENKPGNMEGGGKQTNHPDVYGRKANNHGRGPKTK